jgi:hypothetical protein
MVQNSPLYTLLANFALVFFLSLLASLVPFYVELALYALHEDEIISRPVLAFQVVSHDHALFVKQQQLPKNLKHHAFKMISLMFKCSILT